MHLQIYHIALFLLMSWLLPARMDARHSSRTSMELLRPHILLLQSYVQSFNDVHAQLEQFNTRLNQYYQYFPADSLGRVRMESRKGKLTFPTPASGRTTRSQDISPEELYRKIMNQSRQLPVSNRAEILDKLQKVNQTYLQLQAQTQHLTTCVQAQCYLAESDLGTLYRLLKSCAVMFEDFNTLKGKLYFELEVAALTLRSQESRNPYYAASKQLGILVDDSRALLNALRVGNLSALREKNQALLKTIVLSEKQKNELLMRFSGSGNTSTNPSYRYQQVVDQAKELTRLTSRYLEKPTIPASYREQGSTYYFYNYQHLPVFNHPVQGLVTQFNRFSGLGEEAVLAKVTEVHWFKPNIPSPKSNQADKETGPRHLVFLIDVSGSMREPEKLPLIKRTFPQLIGQLSAEDKITLISFSDSARVVLSAVSAGNRTELNRGIATMKASGEIAGMAGFELAYQEALAHFIQQGNNRVIILSDGGFPVPKSLPRLIEENGYKGITLSAWYTGTEAQKVDSRFSTLTRIGKGNYATVPPDQGLNQMIVPIMLKK